MMTLGITVAVTLLIVAAAGTAFDLGLRRAVRRRQARWEAAHPGMSWADWQARRVPPPDDEAGQ
jgi:hypothetical protein